MKPRILSLVFVLALAWNLVYGQQTKSRQSGTPTQRQLTGKVYSLSPTGEKKPEPKLIVVMEQTGKSDDTNDLGIFYLDLPPAYKSGEPVNLSIKKEGWRLPADGKVRIPYDPREIVEVEMVPTNADAFFTDARFVKLIKEAAEKSTQQAPAKSDTAKLDFGRYIQDWAVQYGFSAQQAKEEIDQWIADIEVKSNDLNRLGLAAFAKRSFTEAAKNFAAAFAQDSTQLATAKKQRQALEEKEKQLTKKAVENARLAGDSYYNDNQFEKALAKYQSAQQLVDKTKSPQQWANLALVMGNANWALGIRTEGEKIQAYLSAAQQAYQQAGEVWPKDREPEGWATVQVSIGNLLSQQGTRTGGEEGAKWLGQAVTAYENALQVYTRAQLPQDWAMTQNNLGTVLSDLGTRTGGEEGAKLLKTSVTALKASLEVRTFEHLPVGWAQSQNNLTKVYVLLEDWPNVAASFSHVLKVYPDYEQAYQTASYLHHEVLHEYPADYHAAFILNQNWLARHPDDLSAQCDFAEKHFTTGLFAECEKRITALLSHAEIEPRVKVALRTIQIANFVGLGQTQKIPANLETLQQTIATQPDTFQVGWTFEGTKHFISIEPNPDGRGLARYRERLLQLFAAIENKDGREAMLAALRKVQTKFDAAK